MASERDLRDLLAAIEKSSPSAGEHIRRRLNRASSRHQFETDGAMVERHVREGEARVARQREIVHQLRGRGLDSEMAECLLAQFEDALAVHKIHLHRLMTGKFPP
jgi:hypothetical protein